jgi:mono/diheme cytochrome c family protein
MYNKRKIIAQVVLSLGLIIGLGAVYQAMADDDEHGYKHSEHRSDKSAGREREEEGEEHEGAEGMRLSATNATWQAECSACHIAYPPALLPASAWKSLMGALDKHFDTDASLDAKQTAEILDFLEKNAAPESRKTASTTPTLRITQTAWFKHEHDEVPASTWKKLKSPSNCLACHTQADQGNFDEHAVQLPK